MALTEGMVVEGKVTGISNFGAFVSLPGNQTGLVHISEIASTYVKDIHDHLTQGQTIKVKVLTIDQNGKISLSIKKAEQPQKAARKEVRPVQRSTSNPAEFEFRSSGKDALSFEDKLNRYKQMSDEKMSDLKRNFESKRGSSYKKSMGSF